MADIVPWLVAETLRLPVSGRLQFFAVTFTCSVVSDDSVIPGLLRSVLVSIDGDITLMLSLVRYFLFHCVFLFPVGTGGQRAVLQSLRNLGVPELAGRVPDVIELIIHALE
jgi:hypothetical protein